MGLDQNTLVIFSSDNGPVNRTKGYRARWVRGDTAIHGHDSNGPFRGWKGGLQEGGHRVPFIARQPGTVPADETTDTLEEWSRPAGATEATITPLDLEWPRSFYSLSHVAVPFPPNDPIYGTRPDPEERFGIPLGTLEPRGERGLMVISSDQFLRLRSNPFFPYIEQRLIEAAGGTAEE